MRVFPHPGFQGVEGANYLCLQASFCSSTAEHIPKKNQINWQVQVQSSIPDLLLPPHPRQGNQPRIFTGRPDAEAEAPILWPPEGKSQLIGKDPDAEKDWRQEEKGSTEDEMVGWHHWLNGWEFEQAQGDGEGQPGLLQSVGPQRVGQDWQTEQQESPRSQVRGSALLPSSHPQSLKTDTKGKKENLACSQYEEQTPSKGWSGPHPTFTCLFWKHGLHGPPRTQNKIKR